MTHKNAALIDRLYGSFRKRDAAAIRQVPGKLFLKKRFEDIPTHSDSLLAVSY